MDGFALCRTKRGRCGAPFVDIVSSSERNKTYVTRNAGSESDGHSQGPVVTH